MRALKGGLVTIAVLAAAMAGYSGGVQVRAAATARASQLARPVAASAPGPWMPVGATPLELAATWAELPVPTDTDEDWLVPGPWIGFAQALQRTTIVERSFAAVWLNGFCAGRGRDPWPAFRLAAELVATRPDSPISEAPNGLVLRSGRNLSSAATWPPDRQAGYRMTAQDIDYSLSLLERMEPRRGLEKYGSPEIDSWESYLRWSQWKYPTAGTTAP